MAAVSAAKSTAIDIGALAGSPNRRPKSHLCLCFVGTPRSGTYYLRSVPFSNLFGSSESQPEHDCTHVLKEVKSWECASFGGIGLLPTADADHGTTNLYVVSCSTPAEADDLLTPPPAKSFTMLKYDTICNAESVQIFNEQSTAPMLSSWSAVYPILVEIRGLIYVISEYQYYFSEGETFFQVYDPKCDTWKSLPRPPCYSDRYSRLSYVVIDNYKLCLSTYYCSSTFDTINQKWTTCNLFDDWNEFAKVGYMDRKILGPPLPFFDQGLVIYGKFLVCVLSLTGEVVSFTMNTVDWKISSPPRRLLTRKQLGMCDVGGGGLVDLGNGYICLVGSEYGFDGIMPLIAHRLKICKFKISIAQDGETLMYNEAEFQISTINLTGSITKEQMISVFAC